MGASFLTITRAARQTRRERQRYPFAERFETMPHPTNDPAPKADRSHTGQTPTGNRRARRNKRATKALAELIERSRAATAAFEAAGKSGLDEDSDEHNALERASAEAFDAVVDMPVTTIEDIRTKTAFLLEWGNAGRIGADPDSRAGRLLASFLPAN